jgi:hypothetical protein
MRHRDRIVRTVIVIGVLTTIATSAPNGFVRDDSEERSLVAQDVVHVTIAFTAAASEQADSLRVELSWTGGSVTVIPDDPELAAPSLDTRFATVDLRDACLEAGPCTVGFSIDAGESTGTLTVLGIAERFGDASFCFPDSREFVGDATVEVTFDGP